MIKILITSITLLLSYAIKAQTTTYPSLNINLLSHINPEKGDSSPYNNKYSGCWGWYQANKNKEYAIVGTSNQSYFVDITNPTSPILCDSVKAIKTKAVWREIKTYQNYCYIVSDDAGANSFQIIDLQYLPDSVHVIHNSNTIFSRCHTIFIDNNKLYCGSVKDANGYHSSMRVYDLTNPTFPTLIRKLEDDVPFIDHVHDMFARNDTIFASCAYDGLQILTLTSANTFSLIQSFTNYQFSGYNHSSYQTENRNIVVMADEVPDALPLKILDVSDLNNIQVLATVNSHSLATPHNPYIVGNNWCWSSNYQDGIYLFDISNPASPSVYGYFDTHPQHGVNDNFSTDAYQGNWGAYPYLPSKNIIALDMQNGLFILEGDNNYKNTVVSINENKKETLLFSVYPNPANEMLNLRLIAEAIEAAEITISNTLGDVILKQTISIQNLKLNIQNLSGGLYFVTLSNKNFSETQKIIIQK